MLVWALELRARPAHPQLDWTTQLGTRDLCDLQSISSLGRRLLPDQRLPGSVLGNKPPEFIGCTICGLRKPSSSAEWASTAQLNRAMEQDGDGDLGELVRRMRGS